MKVVHTVSSFAGGLRQSVQNISRPGNDLYSSEIWASAPLPLTTQPCLRPFTPSITSLNLSRQMVRAAGTAVDFDLVHHHGCWSMTSLASLRLKYASAAPLLYSPHGAFIPASLQRGQLLKQCYLKLWESQVLKRVDCFHAISDLEAGAIARLGYAVPIAMIPNGLDLLGLPEGQEDPDAFAQWQAPAGCFKLLFLSRLVPDKGLDILLRALRIVVASNPKVHLIVVGDGSVAEQKKMRRLVAELDIVENVSFAGGIYSEEKYHLMYNADAFVLPSRNDAQGLVVLESLAMQTPVIASRETPSAFLEENGCGWWVELSDIALAKEIQTLATLPADRLREMGAAGRQVVQQRYSLGVMHRDLHSLYSWLKTGKVGAVPGFVSMPSRRGDA